MARTHSIALVSGLSLAACQDPAPVDPSSTTDVESSTSAETSTGTPPGTTTAADSTASDASTGTQTSTTGEPGCDGSNQVPDTPMIIAPTPGTRNLEPANMVIESSPFADVDGDTHAMTELEIWRVAGDRAVERVWAATLTEGQPLTTATIADGTLEGAAAILGMLAQWQPHVVRVRYNDGTGDCGWSEWSTDVDFRTDDGSEYLFDQTVVRDIYLEIPPESWDGINAQAIPPGCVPWQRDYYTGTLTFEGEVFEGVGLRAKGGCGSARNLNAKAGFRVNLGWDDPAVAGCPPSRRLFGQKHLTLNNMVQDHSYLHERMAYRLYQAFGVPTPRVAHIRVHVNGALWGLYLLVETPKRRFLERRFESKNGMLYEGTYWCDLIPPNVPPGEEDTYCLERKFSPDPCDGAPEPDEDPKNYDVLRDMVDQLDAIPPGGFYPAIEGIFDFDTFLSAWAVESVVAHWDGYSFMIINNYRVYHDPSTGLWNLLPHGLDQTFQNNAFPDLDPWNVSGLIAARCLQEPACEAAFAARLAEVNDEFEAMDFVSEVDVIHNLIVNDVYADPRKEVGNFQYEQLQLQNKQWISQRPNIVRDIISLNGF